MIAVMIKKMLNYPKVASAVAVALICASVRITAWLLGTPWSGPSASSAAVAFSLAIFLAFTIVAVVERRRARILAKGRLLAAMDFYAEGDCARDRLARHLRPAHRLGGGSTEMNAKGHDSTSEAGRVVWRKRAWRPLSMEAQQEKGTGTFIE